VISCTATTGCTDDKESEDTAEVINEKPTAKAGPDRTILVEETITFNGNDSFDPDGEIVKYSWDFGDGETDTGVNVEHTYNTAGIYNVTLIVKDNTGREGNDTFTVTVEEPIPKNEPPVAAVIEDMVVFASDIITFNATESNDIDGNISKYSWDFGDGNIGAGMIVEHTYGTPGTYNVTLTVTDDDGAESNDTFTLTVNELPANEAPTAVAGGDREVFMGDIIIFNASASTDSDGNITDYTWDFGDGHIGHGITVEHSYVDADTYNVTLTVTDDDGDIDNDTLKVTVELPDEIFTSIEVILWNPYYIDEKGLINIEILDEDNQTVDDFEGTINVIIEQGDVNVDGGNSYSFIPADQGEHSFIITPMTWGQDSTILKFQDDTRGIFTRVTISVMAGPVKNLTVDLDWERMGWDDANGSYHINESLYIIVIARDQFGNPSETYNRRIIITHDSMDSGDEVPEPWQSGTCSFILVMENGTSRNPTDPDTPIIFFTEGEVTITAKSTVDHSIMGTITINVEPAP